MVIRDRRLPGSSLRGLLVGFLLVATTSTALPARAQVFTAFTQTQSTNNIGWGVNTTRGWTFTVSTPLVVEELAFWDSDLNGLAQPHPVGVWTNAGLLLTSATVPAGTTAPLDGTFRWVATPAVTLQPGTTYVIGAYWEAASPDTRLGGGTSVAFDPRVTLLGGRGINTVGLAFPSLDVALELNANFKARPAPTIPALPRAALFTLAALLLGACLLALRRARQ